MKKEFVTTIFAAIFGTIVAYFVCNMFMAPLENVTIKALDGNLTYTLAEPDPEIFNYRAINPTVEVYVGQCEKYDSSGQCVEESNAPTD